MRLNAKVSIFFAVFVLVNTSTSGALAQVESPELQVTGDPSQNEELGETDNLVDEADTANEDLPDDLMEPDPLADTDDQNPNHQGEAPPPPEAPYPGSEEQAPHLESPARQEDPKEESEFTVDQPEQTPKPTYHTQEPNESNLTEQQPPGTPYIAEDGKVVRRIPHPMAKEGLRRIDKEGVYYYQLNTKLENEGQSTVVRLGTFAPPVIENPSHPELSFESIYGSAPAPIILADRANFLFSNRFGQLSWNWGAGLFSKSGSGRFANNTSDEAVETFNFFVFPLNVSLVYRLNYFNNQFLVPYLEAGADLMTFAEIRSDNFKPKLGGAPATHIGAGLLISVAQDAAKILQMHREYGIHRFWITLEGKSYLALSDKYKFTSNSIFLGIAVDY